VDAWRIYRKVEEVKKVEEGKLKRLLSSYLFDFFNFAVKYSSSGFNSGRLNNSPAA
jgi:hypothetical protein